MFGLAKLHHHDSFVWLEVSRDDQLVWRVSDCKLVVGSILTLFASKFSLSLLQSRFYTNQHPVLTRRLVLPAIYPPRQSVLRCIKKQPSAVQSPVQMDPRQSLRQTSWPARRTEAVSGRQCTQAGSSGARLCRCVLLTATMSFCRCREITALEAFHAAIHTFTVHWIMSRTRRL